ncbi:MAG: FHA domain-containing protein [Lentisphaeria bacterium]|nr:FHA domain-containing protein [Lentisphaeria bacterium]
MKKCPHCLAEINADPEDANFCASCGKPLPEEISPMVASDCKCLEVRYNRNTFLLKNKNAALKIELTPLQDNLKEVTIFMQHSDDACCKLQELPVQQMLKKNKPVVVTKNFNPGADSGLMTLKFYVGCRLDKEVNYYLFTATHSIYDPDCSKEEFKQQIIINQNFNASDAADINFYGGVLENLEKLAGKNANDMIASLGNMPDAFVTQTLERIQYDPVIMEITAESGGELYPTKKLMLKWNDCKLYLLSSPRITLGRSLEKCDLIVRKRGLAADEKPNRTVSREHADLIYHEEHVEIKDKSSFGTWIDQTKLSGESATLPKDANIDFGDIRWHMNTQYCEQNAHGMKMCKTCLRKKIKSMTFSDNGADKEFYLLVWQCCELGRVIGALAGWNVFYRNNAFILRTPAGNRKILSPGTRIECNGQTVEVLDFHQYA